MFALLSGFLRWLWVGPEYPVLIAGPGEAGKTALFERAKVMYGLRREMPPLSRWGPTGGLNGARGPGGGRTVVLWDVGGAEGLRPLWPRYFNDIYGVLYVLNGAAPESWPAALDVLLGMLDDPRLPYVP